MYVQSSCRCDVQLGSWNFLNFSSIVQWNLHRGTRGLVVESGEGITQVGKLVEIWWKCWWIWKCPIPPELDFAYRVVCWNLSLKKIFSSFHIDKISPDFSRCEAVPVFEGYAIPHAIFKMKAGYTSTKKPQLWWQRPAEFVVPLKWKCWAFSGGWTRHHWKTEDSNGHVLRWQRADETLWWRLAWNGVPENTQLSDAKWIFDIGYFLFS